MAAVFSTAKAGGLIDEKPEAVIDATGFESRYTSRYYVWRQGRRRHRRSRWPKLTLGCHSETYLFAALVISEGPSQDSPQFPEAVRQACRHLSIDRLLGDAGYDGEHNHRLAREELGVRSTLIAVNKRTTRKWPRGRYRRPMKRRFPRRLYGHRWHIESAISQTKRRLGPALRSRTDSTRESECMLRILTHDLMILRRAA
ncbi:MAG: transposase [Phycisphaerae bacterium]